MDKNELDKKSLSTFHFSLEGKHPQISVLSADLGKTPAEYDVVVCSAFKGNYEPIIGTLIGSLLYDRGISVMDLARKPAIDMKSAGCWLSSEIRGPVRRIACIELLRLFESFSPDNGMITMLKSAFLTLRHLLENAAEQGIRVRRIAMPMLGTGSQGIDMEYIAVPLFSQCMKMFKTIDELDTIDFYTLQPERAGQLVSILQTMVSRADRNAPTVFISYSSKQIEYAHTLRDALLGEGYSVWIAPEGIPAGSDYLTEIPSAITNAGAVVLMLTEDAMQSPWVRREASSAIGAGKEIIPAQLKPFELNTEFRFLLDGIQILPLWECDERKQVTTILSIVKEKMDPGKT